MKRTYEEYEAGIKDPQASYGVKARIFADAMQDPHLTGFDLWELEKVLRQYKEDY